MKRFLILAALAVVACTKMQQEKIYTEQELGVFFDWGIYGWSEVYNDLNETVTLVTTYPYRYSPEEVNEKTSVIKPGDFIKLEIGAFAPGVSIRESLTATIKLSDGTEILCTRGAEDPCSKLFYENYTERTEEEILDHEGKKFRHEWLYMTYRIDKALVDLWKAN